MTWDKTVRMVAWACFGLMWIALAIFIIRHPQEPTFEDMFPVFAFLALLFAFIILLVISTIGPLIVAWRESRFVRKYGTLVPAVIRDLSDTGIRINNQQMLEIALTVSSPVRTRIQGNSPQGNPLFLHPAGAAGIAAAGLAYPRDNPGCHAGVRRPDFRKGRLPPHGNGPVKKSILQKKIPARNTEYPVQHITVSGRYRVLSARQRVMSSRNRIGAFNKTRKID